MLTDERKLLVMMKPCARLRRGGGQVDAVQALHSHGRKTYTKLDFGIHLRWVTEQGRWYSTGTVEEVKELFSSITIFFLNFSSGILDLLIE